LLPRVADRPAVWKEIDMHRRTLILGAVGLALTGYCPSHAGEFVTFDREAFATAQRADKPIVVFVHAPW
jgi:hypothetical protein